MKPSRLISTRPSGNVVVVTQLESGEMVSHEYVRCGPFVYLEQDVPGMTPYIQIAPDGGPLRVRDNETLEDTVRRMFDAQVEPEGLGMGKWVGALLVLVVTAVWFIR